ncbi:phosphoribosylformylglycinamidine synthase [Thermoanaerobacterium sp. RBIITD]|uniref:phosphoribosylformylglycinamidine synthase n=1 Tax=Thermoanaerobacterium sp. RBIITD TaxID=1550240 RepID=UPI000BB7E692|nr:phosphoribosylformylglycinamidine synthase [Thermoanaerobacterium sp. RBIITD]SNX52678.1 phosphoribosylformylglycinamidine synthase [Thermoanaerobacterium sp. RBIITD]
MDIVRRIFVEKKPSFNIEAQNLFNDLKINLNIQGLKNVRVLNRYDISGVSQENFNKSLRTIFSEPTVDNIFVEKIDIDKGDKIFAIEYLPGQYDQRADSAEQCMQILTQGEKPIIMTARVIILSGDITDDEFLKIKKYCINPVDSREASLEKPEKLDFQIEYPDKVNILENYIELNESDLKTMYDCLGLAMSFEDFKFCQSYFKSTEKRNPTITEIRVIDTYWSDHCRHTTFLTKINNIHIIDGKFNIPVKKAFEEYKKSREFIYESNKKDMCLMDIATIGMKELKKRGILDNLDESDENNACSIVADVNIDGKIEKWLVMFKNETHNHPTEIEPYGGAATCLGGAIRDPLSGRAYVYQAMRVTGSGDPRIPIEDTIQGKLPQRKITVEAAHGYSSYGNQVGLATGQVTEIYDDGYVAKRMEIGAVIGAVPKKNVLRDKPCKGDAIILLGGRTGRDGCGGATGSSKEHTRESLLTCGAEVQKGNPITERKIQRLFRKPEVIKLIKKCNDFGAGGVSVAIGELSDGLEINLDAVPKKYEGLDGTELAISESQERMAVLVDSKDVEKFIELAHMENLEATKVAVVTDERRVKMIWKGNTIVDISRDFLNTNGVTQETDVVVKCPDDNSYFENAYKRIVGNDIKELWLRNLEDLNVCSQIGLSERFDSTIGAATVLMPFGGIYQNTPSEGMAAKIPVLNGDTSTGTLMAFGYNPKLAKWSPFHGAVYAIIEAVAKVVAMGGNYKRIRLTLQEYFEKLGNDPLRWGKPFSALLGALYTQKIMGIPAIGGKDSMSGTFMDMDVPPTLVAFALDVIDVNNVISSEFKKSGHTVILIKAKRDETELPEFNSLHKNFSKINELIKKGFVVAASSVKYGGLAECITKMAFGNKIGFRFDLDLSAKDLFTPDYGSIVLEVKDGFDIENKLKDIEYTVLGKTTDDNIIYVNNFEISLDEALKSWEKPLENIFPTRVRNNNDKVVDIKYEKKYSHKPATSFAKPRVLIPVFPGTNCEYDSKKAFEKAGAIVDIKIFKNLSINDIKESIEELTKAINYSQIIMLPGGFSAGDEPDGSGKFIATVFRNPFIKDAVMDLLKNRDGLMLGICNGFQALIKLGLLPFGEIRDIEEDSPTLTFNTIGRHVSCMVRTKIASTLSPWFNNVRCGDIHTIAVSHGEGRFIANEDVLNKLKDKGQIATQYVDLYGNPTMEMPYNPNGSAWAIEGITSPDGRILGKMGHSERIGPNVAINVEGNKDQKIFEAGVQYFR